MATWARDVWGGHVQLTLVQYVIPVATKQGGEVRAYTGDGNSKYQVLFKHARLAVCEEWRDEFIKQTGGEVPAIRLPRTCPQCTGVGRIGEGDNCAACWGSGTVRVDPAQIPAEEAD